MKDKFQEEKSRVNLARFAEIEDEINTIQCSGLDSALKQQKFWEYVNSLRIAGDRNHAVYYGCEVKKFFKGSL